MPTFAVPLAHAGEGATWQALLSALAVGVAVVFVLAVVGRIRLESGNDLVLPLAAVAIVASLAPTLSSVFSDWVWWAFPVGCVLLATLLLATFTDVELAAASPTTISAVALAVLAVLVLDAPITRAWHPPPEFLPTADDAEVAITAPEDGSDVDAGALAVEVTVSGATVGPGGLTIDQLPPDPEQLAQLNLFLDGRPLEAEPTSACTVAQPCQSVGYEVEVEPGEHDLLVELVRGDGTPFAPIVFARSTFTAE